MTRALRVEIRRSPMRWVFPLLLALDLGMLFGRDTLWIGVWPQASVAAQNPAWFIAPVVAASAAWSAGRLSRARASEQLAVAPRPGWQREAVQLTATLVYGWTVLATGAAVAAAVSVGDAGPGFLWPSYLVLGASMITLATAVGHAMGRMVRSLVAPPVAAAAVVSVLVWGPDSLHVVSGPPHLEVTTNALVARVALAAAAVTAALVAGSVEVQWRGWVRGLTPSMAALLATAVAVVALSGAGPLRVQREAPDPPLCSDGSPTVCIWPQHRRFLPSLDAVATRLAATGAEVDIVVPGRFHERGLHGPVDQDLDGFVLHLAGEWPAVRGMAASVLNATFPGNPCRAATEAAGERRSEAQSALTEWLVNYAFGGPKPEGFFGGDPAAEAVANQVFTLPEVEQFAWADEQVSIIKETPCAT